MALIEFLLQAKRLGYAGDEDNKREYDDGSRGFEVSQDGYRYLDRYYGFNPFAGCEKIYASGGPLCWIMNYYGEMLCSEADPSEIYSFLKEAMRLISPAFPFRGPAVLEKGSFKYENAQQGSINRFHGIESIYRRDEKVYVLYYHGGMIEKSR